jgi:hypothetical protein
MSYVAIDLMILFCAGAQGVGTCRGDPGFILTPTHGLIGDCGSSGARVGAKDADG